MINEPFIYHRRIYYADTDAGGIVYHANYLRFGEEARAEWLRSSGICKKKLMEQSIFFIVTQANVKYHKPALLDDLLSIETRLIKKTRTRFFFSQMCKRQEEMIAEIDVVVACINSKGRPCSPPDILAQ